MTTATADASADTVTEDAVIVVAAVDSVEAADVAVALAAIAAA